MIYTFAKELGVHKFNKNKVTFCLDNENSHNILVLTVIILDIKDLTTSKTNVPLRAIEQ